MLEVNEIESKDQLIDYLAANSKAKYLFFWGHTGNASQVTKTCFSQWHHSSFEIDNVYYATAEHYMMAEKARVFNNDELALQIIEASHPNQAKALGRQVTGFTNEEWNKHRFDIVVKGNLAKFSQNLDLKEFLLTTENRVLVEASPVDKIWGIGLAEDHIDADNPLKWKGLNLLGFALMVVRKKIKEGRSNE